MKLPKQYSDLKEWAIAHFRVTAGYIPPIASHFDDLPTFRVFSNHWMYKSYYAKKQAVYVLKYAQLFLQCNEPLCCSCADRLDIFVQPFRETIQVVFLANSGNEPCCCCGGTCIDEIPF